MSKIEMAAECQAHNDQPIKRLCGVLDTFSYFYAKDLSEI